MCLWYVSIIWDCKTVKSGKAILFVQFTFVSLLFTELLTIREIRAWGFVRYALVSESERKDSLLNSTGLGVVKARRLSHSFNFS